MAKPDTLKTEISDFIKFISPLVEDRANSSLIEEAWQQLFANWEARNLAPTSLKNNISKIRKAIREKWGDQCFALSIVSHISEMNDKIKREYEAKIATQHRQLVHIPRWRDIVAKATAMLKDESPYAILAGLLLVTGRRRHELLSTARFDTIFEPLQHQTAVKIRPIKKWALVFEGQAKTKQASGTKFNIPYEIPTLAPATLVVDAFERFRSSRLGAALVGLDHDDLAERGAQNTFTNDIKMRYITLWPEGEDFTPRMLRNLYAEICWKVHPHNGVSKPAYFAGILGHGINDIHTSLSYMSFTLDDGSEAENEFKSVQQLLLAQELERGNDIAAAAAESAEVSQSSRPQTDISLQPDLCRAARGLLGWTQPDLAKQAEISHRTVTAFEAGTQPRHLPMVPKVLAAAFSAAGIEITECGVRQHGPTTSGALSRAARGLLGWTREEIATRANISLYQLSRLEQMPDLEPPADLLTRLWAAYGAAGVQVDPDGVQWSSASNSDTGSTLHE